MSYKSILVHLKPHHDNAPAIDAAVRIAKTHDAIVAGLYTLREIAMLKLVVGADHRAVHEAEERLVPPMEKTEASFRAACEVAGVRCSWDVAEGNSNEVLCLAGRCHDLIIVQQTAGGLDNLGTDIAEECAVASGVPTLVVPHRGIHGPIGQRIVIAWNHSRQAASAVQGAMPFIERAEKVIVLMGEKRDPAPSVTRTPQHDIGAYLRLHNAEVEIATFDSDGAEAGVKLLAAAHGARGDMLVMGAYGRSAWREFLLGGATRHVITHLDLPVLMGH
jgi:nucleotide-binding universal stress UspA family protein